MPAESKNTIVVDANWQNMLAAPNTALQGQDLMIQVVTRDVVDVVAGGANAPDPSVTAPFQLNFRDSLALNATSIWVRTLGEGNAKLAVLQTA